MYTCTHATTRGVIKLARHVRVQLSSSQAMRATPELFADKKGLYQNNSREDTHANVALRFSLFNAQVKRLIT